jgi:hypothetical protein
MSHAVLLSEQKNKVKGETESASGMLGPWEGRDKGGVPEEMGPPDQASVCIC